MKIKLILFTLIFGFAVSSCEELELKPKGILGEPELFGTAYGVQKYFVQLYMNLPIEDFIYYANNSPSNNSGFNGYMPGNNNYWQAYKNSLATMGGEIYGWNVDLNEGGVGYWPYDRIRIVNVFINSFPNYKSKYDEAIYNSLMAEARFLRAFFYQGMAKRYGGVPIISEVQDPINTPAEELQVPRSTEYDTWKFIYEDLKFAMENMNPTSVSGRANKYVAAALMSRSMLYAGRVAKYTRYLGFETEAAMQGGFIGMDPSKAEEFFQYAYDAGLLIKNGPYALYTKNYPDKATNFANLFLDKTSSENIFVKGYDGLTFGHCYDALMSPNPDFSSFVGAEGGPVLQFMQMYDFPALTDAQGKPVRFDKRSDIKNAMEPRLQGTCYFDGDVLRGKTFSIQRGIYVKYTGTTADAQNGSNAAPINATSNRKLGNKGEKYNNVLITGDHGMFSGRGGENNAFMGAFIRKYIDVNRPTNLVNVNKSNQSWIVFRLAEIYLNTAEAAYELGKRTEAFDYVQAIRERAGSKVTRPTIDQTTNSPYGYPIEAGLQFIRDERARELYCENHYWWDLKTWRITDQVLNNRYLRALTCYYVFDEGKYIYLDEINRDNRTKTASKRAAYEKIPQGEINKNPKLLPQNPLY
ncbi:MAG: RagB/SusD family nutrient uptake outer membrane protein [Prolixibacteraceae bacterium]|nr:RagB/SusD family nutrient uptake outer membrane protein [Prolixibacteraceae bacterium]